MPLPKSLNGQLRLPLIGAPMFIVSTPELVLAQCKAGIIGAFPALNARPQPVLDEWLSLIRDELQAHEESNPSIPAAPFAVNQICHQSNDRLMQDVEACVKYKVPIIITSLRPPAEVVEAVHGYGGLVYHDVINIRHARKAIEQGVDGIITVCSGAGGHAGTTSPFALVKEVRRIFDGTIILSGAMSSGNDILAAQAIGADLAYFGTRFIATQEANAKDPYKQMVVDSTAADIVYTDFFSGVYGSYLRQSIDNSGFDPDELPEGNLRTMNFGTAGKSKVKAWRDVWSAGQGVGSIDDVPTVAELVDRLETEYRSAARELKCAQ